MFSKQKTIAELNKRFICTWRSSKSRTSILERNSEPIYLLHKFISTNTIALLHFFKINIQVEKTYVLRIVATFVIVTVTQKCHIHCIGKQVRHVYDPSAQ